MQPAARAASTAPTTPPTPRAQPTTPTRPSSRPTTDSESSVCDDARLDSAEALEAADPELRRLAEAGARVRLETGAGAEEIAELDPTMTPRAVVAAGAD